jgi:hypothetical protein
LNRKLLFTIVLLAIIGVFAFANVFLESGSKESSSSPKFYLGVTANGNVIETKTLIDKTKGLINLIVIDNTDTMKDKTRLVEVCNYAYNAGLSFYVYMYDPMRGGFNYDPIGWVVEAKETYGNNFLGYYLYDEPGGNQLDNGNFSQFAKNSTRTPLNYRDAANTYCYYLFATTRNFVKTPKLVTSDYALYWFDYEAGYDTIFCEFGWNHSRPINIALCRGAAEIHNKDWGVMITWTNTDAPYLESGDALYNDMVTAYDAGAKYVIVFNHPQVGPYGLLAEEHFEAMKRFNAFSSANPQQHSSNTERIAYVLPRDFGFGFRRENDTFWGIWDASSNATSIWKDVNSLTEKYGYNFDIIYNDTLTHFVWNDHYNKLIP